MSRFSIGILVTRMKRGSADKTRQVLQLTARTPISSINQPAHELCTIIFLIWVETPAPHTLNCTNIYQVFPRVSLICEQTKSKNEKRTKMQNSTQAGPNSRTPHQLVRDIRPDHPKSYQPADNTTPKSSTHTLVILNEM
jgi:hypothetical protein